MREILFRGKRVDNGEWVYGDYRLQNDEDAERMNYMKIYITPRNLSNRYEVIPETVGQFTGLRDKNGVMIFEGDKVLAGHYKWECKVIWDAKCSRFICHTNDKPCKLVYVDMCDNNNLPALEVIGNIHDNPELLK